MDREVPSAGVRSADKRIPEWVTRELVTKTIDVWQPYYEHELTEADAVEILTTVGQIIDAVDFDA